MNKQTIVCDSCFQSFDTDEVRIREEALTEGRTGMYFHCPRCDRKYTFASITDKGKLLKKQLERLAKKIRSAEEDKKAPLIDKHREKLVEYGKEVKGPYMEEEVVK